MPKAKNRRRTRTQEKRTERGRQMKRIDVLPDDTLLEIFGFYTDISISYRNKPVTEAWKLLVHVCRRWRNVVFGSPRRLNLRLYCTPETPAKDTLDIWPALPLIVEGIITSSSGTDNIIAALRQGNRVRQVILQGLSNWQLEKVFAPMQAPFPELTVMQLSSHNKTAPVIPGSFLGGSAPRLQYLDLDGIPLPGLPNLLLSANHLVSLRLSNIPHSGYISPEAVVGFLSVLSSLESLSLQFRSSQSRPDWEGGSSPPPKRSVLPALKILYFKGINEYLEDLVTRIDTPQLKGMRITFFNQIDFDCSRFAQFIIRTQTLALKTRDKAIVQFDSSTTSVKLRHWSPDSRFDDLEIAISCRKPDWQLSSIEQVCNSSFPLLSMVKGLHIEHYYLDPVWEDDAIDNTLWLQLLRPFTAVKILQLFNLFVPGVAAGLEELVTSGGGITEVLPSLQNIFVDKSFQGIFGQFVAARQLSGHPVSFLH